MSANRIKGITVEIGSDTAKLQTALKGVNGEIRNTQAEDIRHKTASYTHSHNADCYGISFNHINKHGTQFNENHIPAFSLPFKVENASEKTVSLAIVPGDKDAYPVTGGFAWIHWFAANITRFEIRDNASQTATDFVQGRNSWTGIQGSEQFAVILIFDIFKDCSPGFLSPPFRV